MLAERYAEAARGIIEQIARGQMETIRRAGQAVADALLAEGAFWLYHIGHGGEIELRNRAGGLASAQVFDFRFEVSSPIADARRGRPRAESVDSDIEAARLAVRGSELRAGDALLLASVSGRNSVPVEVALAAKDLGLTVIAITSLEYTAQVESMHPSGKKLCDVADIVIDNGAPFGDACVEADGYDHKILPISGVAQIVIGWMICGEVIERMTAAGKPPRVYQSLNRPGGPKDYEKVREQYHETGY